MYIDIEIYRDGRESDGSSICCWSIHLSIYICTYIQNIPGREGVWRQPCRASVSGRLQSLRSLFFLLRVRGPASPRDENACIYMYMCMRVCECVCVCLYTCICREREREGERERERERNMIQPLRHADSAKQIHTYVSTYICIYLSICMYMCIYM